MIDQGSLGVQLLRDGDRLDHRLDLALQVVALIDHVGDVGARAGLVLEERDLVEDAEDLIRIDRPERQVIVGIAAIVEVEAAQHPLGEQPGHDLLDVLRQVVMPGVHQHPGLRAGGAGEQQRHAPVGDVGVIERRLERLVFDEHPLIARRAPRAPPAVLLRTTACACRMFAVPG